MKFHGIVPWHLWQRNLCAPTNRTHHTRNRYFVVIKQIALIDCNMKECQVFKIRLLWDKIDKLFHLKDSQVRGVNYIPINNTLHLGEDHKLHFTFNSKYNKDLYNDFGSVLPNIVLQNNDDTYVIPHGYAAFHGNLNILSDKEQEMDININRIDYGHLEDGSSYYWRYIYPIRFSRWFLQMESLTYIDEEGLDVGLSYIKTIIENSDMHIFLTERNNSCYMVIQSGSKIDSDEMYKRVFAITTTIGMLTGNIVGDYHFQMASDDKDFDVIKSMIFGSLEDTKYSCYRIVNNRWIDAYEMLGKYEYQQYAQEIIKEKVYDQKSYYDNKLVKATVIDSLVNLCYSNNDIVISASMLVEGSMLKIIYQPAFFHIVLETITSALMRNEMVKKQSVIENKEYNRIVKPVLLNALRDIKELSDDAKKIYSNRIESSLNSPANKDKLTLIFDRYGYVLTNEDKEAISQRNSTLHGHLSNIKRELSEQRGDMYAVALRLHKLCCILLLKAAGFEGEILNNEVLFGVEKACERKDPPYLNI